MYNDNEKNIDTLKYTFILNMTPLKRKQSLKTIDLKYIYDMSNFHLVKMKPMCFICLM